MATLYKPYHESYWLPLLPMEVTQSQNFFSILFFLSLFFLLGFCNAVQAEIITPTQYVRDGDIVVSEDGSFQLGFFSRGSSKDRYVGIWFGTTVTQQTVVWVANRGNPVKDSSGVFKIWEDGNLVVLDGNGIVHWSSNATLSSSASVGELLNTGNLVLRYGESSTNGSILWQSFDYPSDTFLADMKFGLNFRTGENQLLKSWKSENDPSYGNFSLGFDSNGVAQIVIWNSSTRHWRSGLWNGQQFVGIPEMTSFYLYGFTVIKDKDEGRLYSVYSNTNKSVISTFVLSPSGKLERSYWNDKASAWNVVWSQPISECQMYGKCGPNGNCNLKRSPICSCLIGFVPRSVEEWNRGNWSGGCVRRKALECKEGRSNAGFFKVSNVKLPDDSQAAMAVELKTDCENWCRRNCSCIAFAYEYGLGCLTWFGDLKDIQILPTGGLDLCLRLAKSELKVMDKRKLVPFLLAIASVVILLVLCVVFSCKRIRKERGLRNKENSQEHFLAWGSPMNSNRHYLDGNEIEVGINQGKGPDLPLFSLDIVRTATNDFSRANELGEGGFGHVYKGMLPSGQEIAVKRLSKGSGQGLIEFENEVILIAKLQHRNLVRLLGYCIQGEEKLLIYEYMPNKSLDAFLFDPTKRDLLDWKKRFHIIEGIARGLLYLHRDSRLRIIHRDLKASNILLDEEMNPKISDFGMARIFGGKQNQENTIRVVGTYGYMSPEYAMEGFFSVKSDVFSFGVILLEIVIGRRNSSFYHPDQYINLLGYAWELWKEDKMLELLDLSLQDSCIKTDVYRCIQVGLLCVQDCAADRPTMDSVLFMLGSEALVLAKPQKPAFSLARTPRESDVCASSSGNCSSNIVTNSMVMGR